jgi:hypothetical protein
VKKRKHPPDQVVRQAERGRSAPLRRVGCISVRSLTSAFSLSPSNTDKFPGPLQNSLPQDLRRAPRNPLNSSRNGCRRPIR